MNMIERMARAICYANVVQANEVRKASGAGHKALVKTDEELRASVDKIWMTSVPLARAAIEAMRCPPEDIVWAGAEELVPGTSYVDAQDVWHAMINAALNEEREEGK